MTFRLGSREAAGNGIQRILLEEIDQATDRLGQPAALSAADLHETRKALKKARAVLRLVRPVLGDCCREADQTLRDTGRALSDARDADSLSEALDDFHARDRTVAPEAIRPMREWLTAAAGNRRARLPSRALRRRLRSSLLRLKADISSWPFDLLERPVLAAGAEQIYHRGRREMELVAIDADDGALHNWRKRVKYHWYHVRVLFHAWPEMQAARTRELKQLADHIGMARDLQRLSEQYIAADVPDRNSAEAQALLIKIERMIGRHRRAAMNLGARLYSQTSLDYAQTLSRWLELWSREPVSVATVIRGVRSSRDTSA